MAVLPRLRAGQCAEVIAVGQADETGDTAEQSLKLKRMGLCEGRRIEMLRNGDPLTLRVAGTRLGVSRHAARTVEVRVCAACALLQADADLLPPSPKETLP